jgi:hypothetical protein
VSTRTLYRWSAPNILLTLIFLKTPNSKAINGAIFEQDLFLGDIYYMQLLTDLEEEFDMDMFRGNEDKPFTSSKWPVHVFIQLVP